MNPPLASPGVWKALGPKAVALILLTCALVYAPVLDAYFLADDFRLFGWAPGQGQSHVLQTHDMYMRPIPGLTMHWEYRLFGLNPVPPRLTNLTLHAAASLLVSALALRLVGSRTIAWAAGLLFAVHPIHTGAVSWLAARYDLFLAVFGLGSLLKLDDYLRTRRPYFLGLTLLLLVGALLSKETAVALPPILALWALLRRAPGQPLPWGIAATMAAMLAAYLGLRITVLGELSPGARVMPSMAGLAYDLAIFPWKLLLTPFDASHWAGQRAALTWGLLALGAATVVAVLGTALARARGADPQAGETRPTRASLLHAALFALGLHQICMLAMFSVAARLHAPIQPTRLLYLPSAGFCLLLALLLGSLPPRLRRGMLGAWVAAYGVIAIGNNLPWRESGRITHAAVTQVQAAVAASDIDQPTLLVSGLPENVHDAYTFLQSSLRNALSLTLETPHQVQEVGGKWTKRTKDLRHEVPIAETIALRWNPESGEMVDETSRLHAATTRYWQLPKQAKTWAGKHLAAWAAAADGFTLGKGGLSGVASRYTSLRSPKIPMNAAKLQVSLSLRSAPGPAPDRLEPTPRVYVKWKTSGRQTLVPPQIIRLDPSGRQEISIPCPGVASVDDLDREGLDLELLFAVEGHRLFVHRIRANKLPSVLAARRKSRQSRRPGPPQQSGVPPPQQSERD